MIPEDVHTHTKKGDRMFQGGEMSQRPKLLKKWKNETNCRGTERRESNQKTLCERGRDIFFFGTTQIGNKYVSVVH